jgi:hypothetical protein
VDQNGRTVRQELVTDPATLLALEAIVRDSPVEVGQFQPGGDPVAAMEAMQAYAAWLMHDAGISGSDLLRTSGDPRSGYALSLSNECKRAAQRRNAPQFRDADQRLVALSAILLNRATGSALPEDGYSVVYTAIPQSPEELQARRQHLLDLMGKGLMSKVDVYMELHPGLTREQAAKELQRIQTEDASGDASSSPFAEVGLPALVQAGIIGASAARRLLGVGEGAAPTAEELAALKPAAPPPPPTPKGASDGG